MRPVTNPHDYRNLSDKGGGTTQPSKAESEETLDMDNKTPKILSPEWNFDCVIETRATKGKNKKQLYPG